LRKQGAPSFKIVEGFGPNDNVQCLYRGSNDRKCAAGIFIPDHLYSKSFERIAVSIARDLIPLDIHPLGKALMAGEVNIHDTKSMDLLNHLQVMHDNIANNKNSHNNKEIFVYALNNAAKSIAHQFKLEYQ
jgi:hypothetical protein